MPIKFSPVEIEERKKLSFDSGDTLRVWSKIEDKGKTRLQAFEGIVLARKHGAEIGATFTVRKVSGGIGVERIFKLYSPLIDKVEIVKKSRTRRSKLYYIRDKAIRDVKRKMKTVLVSGDAGAMKEEAIETPEETDSKE
jgi:large subunit ribosomal protein L19